MSTGDKSYQTVFIVHNQVTFQCGFPQNLFSVLQRSAYFAVIKYLWSSLPTLSMVKRQIFYIAVGNDALNLLSLSTTGSPLIGICAKSPISISVSGVSVMDWQSYRFRTVLPPPLRQPALRAHIFANKSDAALTRYSNYIRLGNRVHRRTNNGNVQVNVGVKRVFKQICEAIWLILEPANIVKS